ncbi:MAG TPA: Pr6Pr family membrane protein [Sphingomicrobium sp.]|nr:Pr6Pr family membrane protein [Sphingomicrobium sp.]
MRNAAAALVAIICWLGLAVQFAATLGHQHQVVSTLWILARFFTITTSLLVALLMTWTAIGRRVPPLILGGITLSELLVGVVYGFLLRGLEALQGPASMANVLLHDVSPVLMTLWWLLFAPRDRLKWNAPWLWALYPVAYLVYVLARGRFDGRYPYPFINLPKIGWLQTALNVGGIALGFLICGFLLVWIDSWRPLGSKRSNG